VNFLGKLSHNYGKLPLIVDLPIPNGDFPVRYVNVYHRVSKIGFDKEK
jgi:hypothetical protein